MQSFVSVQSSSLRFISVMRGSVQCSSVASKDPFCSFSSTFVSVLVISFQFNSVRFGSVVINGQLRSFIFRFNAVHFHFTSLQSSPVQFSAVQFSSHSVVEWANSPVLLNPIRTDHYASLGVGNHWISSIRHTFWEKKCVGLIIFTEFQEFRSFSPRFCSIGFDSLKTISFLYEWL